MRRYAAIFLLILPIALRAQDSLAVKKDVPDFGAPDSLYREDQFYIGFTYDILEQRPAGMQQNKFSSGITFGVLRDMPFNKARTWSVAAGVGIGIHNYNHNLGISHSGSDYQYGVLPDTIAYQKNKLILDYLDVPIEIRWRTSTPNSHKFWRVYTGIKLGYLLFSKYKYSDSDGKRTTNYLGDLDKFRYGLYLATGYNTWNLNVYYGLNPIFKSGMVEGERLKMHALNVGLMFYIL
jgi:hypothetical protein